ncbi:MAG: hypothetical protein ACFFAV_18020, partial [Candidatus Hermodarchaeota archaeon]
SRGFGNQRVNMYWLSGAESEKFVKSVEDAYDKVKRAGPNPIKAMDVKLPEKDLLITPIE